MKITDKTHPDARLFRELCANPWLVRAIFEKVFYPAPWMGWVPMLCELMRTKKTMTPKKNAKLAYETMVAMGAKPTPGELQGMDDDADRRLSECKCGMAICEDCQQAKAMKELAKMWRS